MKSYKEFDVCLLGGSDYASLIMVGCDKEGKLVSQILPFGEDGAYRAYLVEGEAEIGSHYSLVAEFTHWMNVYDDDSMAEKFNAKRIKVFRAGEFGCIIQLLNE
ncbi:hypothetical protein [uncultured Eubacterium sp.]|uniref:hypothetical protein n=1 Tax=uncultured Eubacterium sp. TaxID=165185 RepID=UPI002595C773|nr:hypothetical protein [uncultured Eubacterium sp.]